MEEFFRELSNLVNSLKVFFIWAAGLIALWGITYFIKSLFKKDK